MKKVLIIILLSLVHIDVYGQTFYNLLKEVIDSTMTKAILKEKKRYIFDNAYKPYKFEYGKLSKNSNKEQKYNYVGDFNAFLGNDTIVVNSFQKDLRHCKENIFCHHFTKLKWHSFYYLGTNYIVYIYNQSTMSWEKSDKRLTYAKWLNEIELKKRTYLLDCIDQALKEFLETVAFPSTNSILVIDNSLGEHFFLVKYSKKRFPYMVASQEDLTKKVLKKYKNLIGWCSIDLDGNTLSIQLRAVDSDKYKLLPDKDNVDDAVIATQTYHFRYCDEHKKWCIVK